MNKKRGSTMMPITLKHTNSLYKPTVLILLILLSIFTIYYLNARFSWLNGKVLDQLFVMGLFMVIGVQSIYILRIHNRIPGQIKSLNAYEQLDSFIRNTSDAFDIVDLEGKTIKVNKAFEDLFGWTEAELVGNKLPIIPEHLVPAVNDFYQEIKAGKTVAPYETVRQHKDGTLIDVSILISPIKDAGNNIVALAAIVRDIRERKKTERALWETTQTLQSIIHSSPMAIVVFDPQAKVKLWNHAAECMFGWKEHEVLEQPVPFVAPEKRSEFEALFQKELLGVQLIGKEVCRQKKDGSPIFISIWSAPLYDPKGSISGIMTIMTDISERKMTEELLQKSDKLSAVGQLAAGVAHEIRNPLTTLKGFLQLYGSKIEQHHHRIMISELDRINFIVSEFLVLSKPQATQYQIKNLQHILQHVIAIFDTQTILKNIQLVTHLGSEPLFVFCEENQLKQVFINVLKNAMEAMPKGGNINISLQKTKDHASVRIMDEGCGIPEDNIPRLGEPFYSTKPEGTGLGLMVTYKIIEDHDGSMMIQSRPQQGTTVEIMLPLTTRE